MTVGQRRGLKDPRVILEGKRIVGRAGGLIVGSRDHGVLASTLTMTTWS